MKKIIAILMVLATLFLCACSMNSTKKLSSSNSGDNGQSENGQSENGNQENNDLDADVIDVQVAFTANKEDIQVTLTNGSHASVTRSFVDGDVAQILELAGVASGAKLTWNYQYDGMFRQDGDVYNMQCTSCTVSINLEADNKELVTAALLASVQASGASESVYACYQKLLAGESCDAAELEGFVKMTWILEVKDGTLVAVQMFDSEVKLTASIEFYSGNRVKSYIGYDNVKGTRVEEYYNENGDPTTVATYGAGGILTNKTEYEYYEDGAIKSQKRYVGVALDYECQYDAQGKVTFEKDYGADKEGSSDTFFEGDEMPDEEEDIEEEGDSEE